MFLPTDFNGVDTNPFQEQPTSADFPIAIGHALCLTKYSLTAPQQRRSAKEWQGVETQARDSHLSSQLPTVLCNKDMPPPLRRLLFPTRAQDLNEDLQKVLEQKKVHV
jgi:hypothetical protein